MPAVSRGYTMLDRLFQRSGGRVCNVVAIALAMFAWAPVAHGETTGKEVQVMLKAIGFLSTRPSGAVQVAVVFDPSSAASKQDAEAVKAQLDGAAGALQPKAQIVSTDQLAGFSGVAAIVAAGVSPAGLDAVAKAAHGKKMLTLSSDSACAKAGKCVLAVKAEPKVEILLNAAAARDGDVEFQSTFKMMITEI